MASWDYVLKFVIIGDAGLTDQRFLASPDPTLGVEFGSKLIHLPDEDKTVKLQCWSFRSITRSYYRGAAGALLVYDVTSRTSFTNCRSWLKDVRSHADPNLTAILVANKVDLCEQSEPDGVAAAVAPARREVSREEAEQWAKEEDMLFIEASAKSGVNVDAAFDQAARDILLKIKRGVFDDSKSPGVRSAGNRPGAENANALTLETAEAKTRCCS
ncbi:ras-domain-containing protein [Exidia glandulosa HHB12029]|uniref:Ras-domain-containing protein n=1 Tax=Exidia glandulosa HHB12029 TaxID=1314781 RepID=A0A166A0B7_EXIGL|nr:ras-domain-containing protein [Exidia glandulosa HHB12029]